MKTRLKHLFEALEAWKRCEEEGEGNPDQQDAGSSAMAVDGGCAATEVNVESRSLAQGATALEQKVVTPATNGRRQLKRGASSNAE